MVLEWFWTCVGRLCGAKTMAKRQREDLWKLLFYRSNIAVFVVCGLIWGARMREKQNGIPSLIKTRFYGDFGSVLRVILVVQINGKSDRLILEGFQGRP